MGTSFEISYTYTACISNTTVSCIVVFKYYFYTIYLVHSILNPN